MEISGTIILGSEAVEGSGVSFRAVNPATGTQLDPVFREAGPEQVDRAFEAAEVAFEAFGESPPLARAQLLRAIAVGIEELGETLLQRAHEETALPIQRLESERSRTVGQLRLFADLVEEGSWVDARIDRGDPTRAPLPKPDIRRMLVPVGPTAVFGACNFPLAFSVAGGDTASALAAGCSVVYKAHPAHPGTSELTASAIVQAARETGAPPGVFSLLHGWSHDVGQTIVRHPLARAVGFTGSLRGGRALFDAAAARPEPIPVYAEMGSVNPVFLLPSAVAERGDSIADGLVLSITLGVGQFCTNPGVFFAVEGSGLDKLRDRIAENIRSQGAGVMLYERLDKEYASALDRMRAKGVEVLAAASTSTDSTARACPTTLTTGVPQFLDDPELQQEMFGPASILVVGQHIADLERAAQSLDGQLTATIHGTEEDLHKHSRLVDLLRRKVGRLIFNGFPTGVEVGHAMQHGGPYPASTDARTTSVGTAAITRFARPVCYQQFPDGTLPPALRNRNELGIWRLMDGRQTREDA